MTWGTRSSRRPAGRVLVLLVMAVLAGVLGMHALGPGGGVSGHDGTGHQSVVGQVADHQADTGSPHAGGGAKHLDHADATCAAAGIGGPYVPPALTVALADATSTHAVVVSASESAVSGRAPPDLSELQLLRI